MGFNNSTAKPPRWFASWDRQCLAEGWLLSHDGYIERDDDSKTFKDDNAARRFVEKHAKKGSRRHQTALWYHTGGGFR